MNIRRTHTKSDKNFLFEYYYTDTNANTSHHYLLGARARGCCHWVFVICECVSHTQINMKWWITFMRHEKKKKKGKSIKNCPNCNFRHIFTPHRESHTFFPLLWFRPPQTLTYFRCFLLFLWSDEKFFLFILQKWNEHILRFFNARCQTTRKILSLSFIFIDLTVSLNFLLGKKIHKNTHVTDANLFSYFFHTKKSVSIFGSEYLSECVQSFILSVLESTKIRFFSLSLFTLILMVFCSFSSPQNIVVAFLSMFTVICESCKYLSKCRCGTRTPNRQTGMGNGRFKKTQIRNNKHSSSEINWLFRVWMPVSVCAWYFSHTFTKHQK